VGGAAEADAGHYRSTIPYSWERAEKKRSGNAGSGTTRKRERGWLAGWIGGRRYLKQAPVAPVVPYLPQEGAVSTINHLSSRGLEGPGEGAASCREFSCPHSVG